MTTLSELDEPQVVEAVHRRGHRLGRDRFTFESQGKSTSPSSRGFPSDFGKDWEVLVVTPTDDFVGGLKETNRKLLWMMAALALVESVLIYFMARRIARPIEIVSDGDPGHPPAGLPRAPADRLDASARSPSWSAPRRCSTTRCAPSRCSCRSAWSAAPDRFRASRLQPGVEQRFMTVLFSDVEGFTTLAEQLAPHELTEQTSRYFENVTGAVAEEQGTIDKFIGDSVMAFWGAPAELDDHAFHACRAALRARHRMARLSAEWAATGRKPMRVRIGVHCGDVVVGNVGSPERLSYTVMGDGVNIASRLEGMNKQFGSTICISDAILKQVGDRVVSRPLELLSVRGRSGRFVIHELLGIAGSDDPELAASADVSGCASSRPPPGRPWRTAMRPRPSGVTRRCRRSSRTTRWRATSWPMPPRRRTSRRPAASSA